MTISTYVRRIETQFNALLGLDDGDLLLVTDAPLPRAAQVALAGYAPQLVTYFTTGRDAELSIGQMTRALERLGLLQMPNGHWSHPDGDDAADAIVAGLVAPEDAARLAVARDARRREFAGIPPPLPPRVKVEVVEVAPGRYRWTETEGVRTVPVLNGHPLIED